MAEYVKRLDLMNDFHKRYMDYRTRSEKPIGDNYVEVDEKLQIAAVVMKSCFDSVRDAHIFELVRCGECRYCDTSDCPMSGTPGRVSASDFCSYGERKEDNAR